MRGFVWSFIGLLGAAISVSSIGNAKAQDHTTAQYDDWVVECASPQGQAPQKSCDMSQVTQLKGRTTPFSRVSVENPVSGQPVRMMVQLPVNVLVRTDLVIRKGENDSGFSAPLDRCTPAGCFAEAKLSATELQKLQAATGAGTVTFKDSGGHEVVIPLSFKGFEKAFAALSKK